MYAWYIQNVPCAQLKIHVEVYAGRKICLRKIQPKLFTFGVTKKVKHRQELVNVRLPLRAEEPILINQ